METSIKQKNILLTLPCWHNTNKVTGSNKSSHTTRNLSVAIHKTMSWYSSVCVSKYLADIQGTLNWAPRENFAGELENSESIRLSFVKVL